MPYKIEQRKGEYCLINKETGKNEGCSETKELAISHMRAKYGAEGGWEPTGKKRVSQRK